MGVGEGGPEIVKQLLRNTYDHRCTAGRAGATLTGKPRHGVGPHDVAIALCGAVYKNGFVKNKVLEFVGAGVGSLPHGLPHRHRRHDHRDSLPDLHLGDGRAPWRTIWRIHGRAGDLRAPASGERRVLRRT